MKKTSHFVGISFKNEKFLDIFIEISELLGKEINEILEFQNPLSLHISLYYLPKNLTDLDFEKINNIISNIDFSKLNLELNKINYFNDKIAYISYKNYNYLKEINKIFKSNFPGYNSILDNSYENFIPHTTIFKIKNFEKYLIYKEKIENIVEKNLKNIKNITFFDINLFAVNSSFSPELQIIIF